MHIVWLNNRFNDIVHTHNTFYQQQQYRNKCRCIHMTHLCYTLFFLLSLRVCSNANIYDDSFDVETERSFISILVLYNLFFVVHSFYRILLFVYNSNTAPNVVCYWFFLWCWISIVDNIIGQTFHSLFNISVSFRIVGWQENINHCLLHRISFFYTNHVWHIRRLWYIHVARGIHNFIWIES